MYDTMRVIRFQDKFTINTTNLIWANYLEPQKRFKNAMGLVPKSMNILRSLIAPEIIMAIKSEI
jgi:hypothetical protein